MDDVVGRQDQADRRIDWYVQLSVGVAVGIREDPRPFLAEDVNVERVGRRVDDVHEPAEAHVEHDAHEHEWNRRPGDFEGRVVVRPARGRLAFDAAPIADDEVQHERHDQHEEEDRHPVDEVEGRIDVRGGRGARRGQPEGVGRRGGGFAGLGQQRGGQQHHGSGTGAVLRRRGSKRQRISSRPPTRTSDSTPPARTKFIAARL